MSMWGRQVLRMPLFMLPQLVSQLVNARVAINRLQEFLAAEEQPPLPLKPAAPAGEISLHHLSSKHLRTAVHGRSENCRSWQMLECQITRPCGLEDHPSCSSAAVTSWSLTYDHHLQGDR